MHYTSLPFGVIFSQALSPIQGSFKQRETQYLIHMILPSMKLNIQFWSMEGPHPQRIIVNKML